MSSYSNADENPVLPESEVKSVLVYLKSNPIVDAELNSVVSDENSHPADVNAELNSIVAREDSQQQIVNAELTSVDVNIEPNVVVPEIESHLSLSSVESNFVDPSVESNPGTLNLQLDDSATGEHTVVNHNIQVQLKSEKERLVLILPTESQASSSTYSWSDIWQQMKLRLLACERSFSPNTKVHLLAQDRLLDGRQLQELAEILNQFQVHLKSVTTSRRQTAIAAATAGYCVEQIQPQKTLASDAKPTRPPLAEPLYLEKTVRSGEEIRHPGHIILLGDLNPGGNVVADGDILVWGRLRGITHAGASGNRNCMIMALQMEPTQLRIADAVARAPEKTPMQFHPEVAYITPQGIRIARAADFSKILLSRLNQNQDEV